MIAASNLVAVGAPIAVIILAHREGLGGFRIGLFIALQGVALLAGSTVSPLLRRILPMRAILLSEFWMALVYGAFLVYPSVYVLAACAALHAFWFPNTDSAIAAYSYALIPDRLLGRAMAAANASSSASRVTLAWTTFASAGAFSSRKSPRFIAMAAAAFHSTPSAASASAFGSLPVVTSSAAAGKPSSSARRRIRSAGRSR